MKIKRFEKEGNAQKKSYSFALEVLMLVREIQQNKKEYELSRQLLKSATSIGANLHESIGRQSNKDLLTKLHISYKEAYETKYWICLLTDSNYISERKSEKLLGLNEELLKILGSSIKTLRTKINYKP